MADFTYEVPDEQRYMQAVLMILDRRGYSSLHRKLKGARCSIRTSSDYSRIRWNGFCATVAFQIPVSDYSRFTLDDPEDTRMLLKICTEVMPPEAGYDVVDA